ncbi:MULTISPECIES: hypothetical protein [Streptomyces]|uniref:Uncharacterized protein n=1 Tax=Streptomyces griseiscabiei TaxID=2993540 RepID=A0ABU4KZX6_9ACTN|nr:MULTISPECIES: hypothetical protein [Streptomyces]MBZ3900971.1 hypothetical protein [Streptomyces griseiscabiei]MDX2908898.1 hypothetical protein [Streptomyces griseiscabiei]
MSENIAELRQLRDQAADEAAGPWVHSILSDAQSVLNFANIEPPFTYGGFVVSRRPDGQFDVWWRL